MRSPSRISRPWPALALWIAWLPASVLATPSLPAELREVFASSRAPAPLAERDLAHPAIDVHARRAIELVDASGAFRRDCETRVEPHANGDPGVREEGGTTLIAAVRPGTYRTRVRCPDGKKTQESVVAEGELAKLRIDPAAKGAAGPATPRLLGYAPPGPP